MGGKSGLFDGLAGEHDGGAKDTADSGLLKMFDWGTGDGDGGGLPPNSKQGIGAEKQQQGVTLMSLRRAFFLGLSSDLSVKHGTRTSQSRDHCHSRS